MIRHQLVNVQTTWGMALPRNPLRFGIFLPNSGTQTIFHVFTDDPQTNQSIVVAAASGNMWVDEFEIGQLAQAPIWSQAVTALQTMSYVYCEYTAYWRQKIDDTIRANIPV